MKSFVQKSRSLLFVGLMLLVVLVVVIGMVKANDDDDDITPQEETPEPKNILVTCGSIIKLRHKAMGCRLHSHSVKYGSGSGQQSVTCFPGEGDENSYWVVKGSFTPGMESVDSCPVGTVLKNGLQIRLEHAQTGTRLHSHLHQSPLSRQQEVSCYEGLDTGDNWIVELVGSGKELEKGDSFRLKHVDTGKYLHSHNMQYGSPIPGQMEVTSVGSANSNTIWVAEEGVYYPTQKELENH